MLDHEPRFSLKIPPDAGECLLRFVRQLGLTHVYTWISEEQRNREYLSRLAERVHSVGLTLYNVLSPPYTIKAIRRRARSMLSRMSNW